MNQKNNTASKRWEKRLIGAIDVLVIILAIMLLVMLCFLFLNRDNHEKWLAFEKDNPIVKKEKELSGQGITIQGYGDLIVSESQPNLNLINASENDVYLVYTLSEHGACFYETAAIKPGNMVEADIYHMLEKGFHTVTMEIGSYDVKTMEACNGTIQTLQVEVK